MRVTNSMITDRVMNNTQRALGKFLEMQTQMSSGRRINRPSDDPLGIIQGLDIKAELAQNAQYQKNVYEGQNWVSVYDTVLAELKNMVTTAKELAITMGNDTNDPSARKTGALEVRSLFDQMLRLADSQLQGKYIFSGYRTNHRSLLASNEGVRYDGDTGQIKFRIGSAAKSTVNITGDDVFLKHLSILGEDADLKLGVTTSTVLADLHGGTGIDQSPGTIRILDQNLGISVDVDISAATDLNDVINTINTALTSNVPPINNLTAGIAVSGGELAFTTTANGLISNSTPLGNLNSGAGIDMGVGIIRLSDGAGLDLDIDLNGSVTVGDVIANFNAAVAADPGISNVTMQRNATDTGFEIVDANGVPMGLHVEETSRGATAASLGILGDISPNLVGTDLQPVVDFKVEENGGTTAADLGILEQFNGDLIGGALKPALTTTSLLADLNGAHGMGMDKIIIRQGDISVTLDLSDPGLVTIQDMLDAINSPARGLDVTASINSGATGIQIENNNQVTSLIIQDIAGSRVSKDLGIFGSSDSMGTMLLLADSMEADDGEGIRLLLDNLDDSIGNMLNHRSAVGARGIRLQGTSSRLIDMELTFTKRLSLVEDADMTRLITDLSIYENNFQAALMASAKIIQPSLLNFLR